MANIKDIRVRVSSVKNTQQITRAMRMVSAAKLRLAQENIENLLPYARKLLEVIADVAKAHNVHHKLLEPVEDSQKILLVVITSDRGLCGGFNHNINRYVEKWFWENQSKKEVIDFLFVGKKASEYFKTRKLPQPRRTILNLARKVSYTMAQEVARQLMEEFSHGEYDEIQLVYNEFKSVIVQKLVTETLLPVDLSKSSFLYQEDEKAPFSEDLIFEPNPRHVVDTLLHKHFSVQVYRCLCESVAAEHAARMNAMESATNNAKEMISQLTLTYNKLRQAAITTELTEICSGAEALKKA